MTTGTGIDDSIDTDVDREAPTLAGSRLTLARELYAQMRIIAAVEDALLSLFDRGLLSGTVHTCLGQESTAAGVVSALDVSRDIVFSNHRCHGHFLAYCRDVVGLIGEVMGRSNGACSGVGGSQHLHERNFYSNGVLGGIVPVATGMALAEKVKASGAIVCVFVGDGAMAQGAVYESFNMAALWKLPILFVIEDNGYAQSTPKRLEQAGDLAWRGGGWGIPTKSVDGRDVLAVYDAAQEIAATVRTGRKPHVLYVSTYRLGPHSKGDDVRDKAEIAKARDVQPLVHLRASLGNLWCDKCDSAAAAEVSAAIEICSATLVADFREVRETWSAT